MALPSAAALALATWGVHALLRKYGNAPPDRRSWFERKWILLSCAGLLVVYAAVLAYAARVEPHAVELTRTEIPVDRPVLGYPRFRIVHLSDLHLERTGSREHRAVELIRDVKPHLILLTGDYLNRREGGAALDEVLRALQAPYGVFGVEGNWDSKFSIRSVFEQAGARLLVDETHLIRRDAHRLRLAGHSLHPRTPLSELLEGLDDGAFTIYLHHLPEAVDELRGRSPNQKVDLFLCGHTHGGQVALPFWGAILTMSKYHKTYERGLYDVDGVPMYVNRGLGMSGGAAPRLRFLSRPEVAVIDLVAP